MKALPFFAATALLALAGCAQDPVPQEQMRLTDVTLEQATALGADDQIAEMKLAQQKYEAAKVKLAAGRNKDARRLAEQAELDARLAEAKVVTAKHEAQLAQLQSRVNRLRKQLGESSL